MIVGDFNQFDVKSLEIGLSLWDIVTESTWWCNILDHVLINKNMKTVYDSRSITYKLPVGNSFGLYYSTEHFHETAELQV